MSPATHKFSICSDEELMRFVTQGETGAFDEVYTRYAKRLMGYFVRMLNFDRKLAEDALQDLFLKIAEEPERFDSSRSFRTWIFTVAANHCKNYYRHQKVVEQNRQHARYETEAFDDNAFVTSASRIDGHLFRKMLNEVLGQLPPEKREAFILRYQEDKSIAEIALIQGCPEGSVKSRLHYTLKTLEEKLWLFKPIPH